MAAHPWGQLSRRDPSEGGGPELPAKLRPDRRGLAKGSFESFQRFMPSAEEINSVSFSKSRLLLGILKQSMLALSGSREWDTRQRAYSPTRPIGVLDVSYS
jgi:hypothetical protein